jgi:hypothetical protein
MKKIKFKCSLGGNSRREETVEFPDDCSEEIIKGAFEEWLYDTTSAEYWEMDQDETLTT